MLDVAIIGSGAAGLGAAYRLKKESPKSRQYRLSIYEQDTHFGGHANTAVVTEGERSLPVDTGFMVFNKATYPNLTRLFEEIAVPIEKTDMSFSVQHRALGLDYAGASLSRLFGQRKNILNLRFWRMLVQLDRFNKESIEALPDLTFDLMTLEDYVKARGYGDDFLRLYLLPMSSSVWSCPERLMLKFPAKTLLRFFHNHGFLGMDTQHQWWTVKGGSRVYVDRLLQFVTPELRLKTRVSGVRRVQGGQVVVQTANGNFRHDRVIIATHADQALALLESPTELERELLSKFSYQDNSAILHTDQSIMPRTKSCWSSWNYRIDSDGTATTHYWMNSLQNISKQKNYFVSLNAENLVDPAMILASFSYEHPLFCLAASNAQGRLSMLNSVSPEQTVFFCGSYFKYGFHEDALSSGYQAAQCLLKSAVLV